MENAYTFLGTTTNGATLFMDVAVLEDSRAARRYCDALLREHGSGMFVEIWCGPRLIAKVPRSAALTRPQRSGDGAKPADEWLGDALDLT
ncbi:MAG TPA: hypothetical protein VNZ85_10735 [Caulobacter sp.]|nr:hypothetical protein [Caulobacter sp.]